MGPLTWKAVSGLVWSLLTTTIPIPIVLIAATLIWMHFDKTSAVRQAVDAKLTDLTAGAQIDALKARLSSEQELRRFADRIAFDARQRADSLNTANDELTSRLVQAQIRRTDFNAQLESRPAGALPPGCIVTDDLYGRLRNR